MEIATANTVTHFKIDEQLEFYEDLFRYLEYLYEEGQLFIFDNRKHFTIETNMWVYENGLYRRRDKDQHKLIGEYYGTDFWD